MRQIVLDTETTGLDPNQGHRIIELAGLEVVNRRATGRTVHYHLDPEREIDFGATEVHGKTWEDLRGKPKFRDIAGEFLEFAGGAEWAIHTHRSTSPPRRRARARRLPACGGAFSKLTDNAARPRYPGSATASMLCERFGVDHRHRTLHGALLDAELLAEVWPAMTRGRR